MQFKEKVKEYFLPFLAISDGVNCCKDQRLWNGKAYASHPSLVEGLSIFN